MGSISKVINVEQIKEDFPILKRKFYGKPLIYFDNAATSQKPRQVIEAIRKYYEEQNANIHRGIYALSEEATQLYEESKKKVARFINARRWEEIIYTRNTTESINLVAYAWGWRNISKGDNIVLTVMEHHSNLVPWQLLAQEKKVELRFIDIDEEGLLKVDQAEKLIDEHTKLVSITHVSNVLGTINPVEEIGQIAHEKGALFLVDGAQSTPHMPVDVRNIGADFFAFSGHKMLGPMGIGVLYCKREILEKIGPFLGGGDMIKSCSLFECSWNDLPWKFEAGTSNVEGAVGLSAAIDYLNSIGMKSIREHEKELTKYALDQMSEIEDMKIYGPKDTELRGGVISFNLGNLHSHDLASILDSEGIAIRAGHHCAQPLMTRLGVTATARASFYIYNDINEVDVFIDVLNKIRRRLKI
ncbi:MAG: cysteine desulfurase [Thermoprotei archaeon]